MLIKHLFDIALHAKSYITDLIKLTFYGVNDLPGTRAITALAKNGITSHQPSIIDHNDQVKLLTWSNKMDIDSFSNLSTANTNVFR